jgi:hypothetical protein
MKSHIPAQTLSVPSDQVTFVVVGVLSIYYVYPVYILFIDRFFFSGRLFYAESSIFRFHRLASIIMVNNSECYASSSIDVIGRLAIITVDSECYCICRVQLVGIDCLAYRYNYGRCVELEGGVGK